MFDFYFFKYLFSKQEGYPPTRTCDCGTPFHVGCLYEWLRSTPENRQSLSTIYGKCPVCEKPISCPMPH